MESITKGVEKKHYVRRLGKKGERRKKGCLPVEESNPGLLRDRQGYLPLY
jgi:hypothetical protein